MAIDPDDPGTVPFAFCADMPRSDGVPVKGDKESARPEAERAVPVVVAEASTGMGVATDGKGDEPPIPHCADCDALLDRMYVKRFGVNRCVECDVVFTRSAILSG